MTTVPGHEQSRNVPHDMVRLAPRVNLPESTVSRFLRLTDLTPTIADALDEMDVDERVLSGSVLTHLAGPVRLVGTATTLRYRAIDGDPASRRRSGEPARLGDATALAESRSGDVLVIDAGGNLTDAVVGDRVAARLAAGGVVGCIAFGAVRDVGSLDAAAFPVWATGATPRNALHRLETAEVNGPVDLAGVRVVPGDLVAADENGLVVVPGQAIDDVLSICEEIEAREQQAHPSIHDSKPHNARSN